MSDRCPSCGGENHGFKCPLIKAYEYFDTLDENGMHRVKRIEFVTFADVDENTPATILPAHGTTQ